MIEPAAQIGGPAHSVRTARHNKRECDKLRKKLRASVGKAIADFGMIEPEDLVMVCLSGGKDSYTLLDILRSLQRSAPVPFRLVAVHLDQKQPGFPAELLPLYLSRLGVDYHIIERNTYSIVQRLTPAGKTFCPVCARLRRGILYNFAVEIGAHKIALGHHREDIVETLFLNLFHGGKLKAMPPKLLSDDRRNIVIRPLAYCREKDIARFARLVDFPIIPCNLCGNQENLERRNIKEMLANWDSHYPGRIENIASALRAVVGSHLLDTGLHDFAAINSAGLDPGPEPASSPERIATTNLDP